jgi:HD-like signal output (HDOD) protein/CheY-like chemotaxis protein
MKRQILFVDDEASILDGIRRALRDMRNDWDLFFATGASEALKLMSGQTIDVVVSDMKMPGMSGAEFLSEVMRSYPHTVRFVLSGYSEKEVCLRSAGTIHQFLPKPVNIQEIKRAIRRALALREFLNNNHLTQLVSRLRTLPTLPGLYHRVTEELRRPCASIETIGKIIGEDLAMSAKILQLSNSAFLGLAHRVSSPSQAATLIGIESLKTLVLVSHLFEEYRDAGVPARSVNAVWTHGTNISVFAYRIVQAEGGTSEDKEVAYTAGLLHDIGKLVLAIGLDEPSKALCTRAREGGLSDHEAEREVLRTTHAEIGAYLLGLWGLPDRIVEATAFHHCPEDCRIETFAPLDAIHAAHLVEQELGLGFEGSGTSASSVDWHYLKHLGREHRILVWMDLCRDAGNRPMTS